MGFRVDFGNYIGFLQALFCNSGTENGDHRLGFRGNLA